MEHSFDTSAPSLDTYTLNDLLAKTKRIEATTSVFNEDFEAFVGQLDDATQEALADIYDAYYGTLDEGTSGSIGEYWREHGQGILPPDMIRRWEDTEAIQQEWQLLTGEMDQRFGEELGRYVCAEAQLLLTGIDPQKVEQHEHWERDRPDRDWSTDLRYALIDLKLLAEITPTPNYHQASVNFDRLEKCRELLEEKGVVGDSDEPKEVFHNPAELQRAQELRLRYRGDFYGRPLDQALETPMLPSHDYKVWLAHEQQESLEEYLGGLDRHERLEALDIEGLEDLPFNLTAEGLRYMLRGVPALAFEGVEAMEFRDISGNEHSATQTAGLWEGGGVTLGLHVHLPSANSARIVINSKEIAEMHDHVSKAIPNEIIARSVTLDFVRDTVFHEFGHAFHYKLPVALLHAWDEAARGEAVYVSDYVEQKATHHGADQAHVEDFAESFMLFLTNPQKLSASSPARYAAMADICRMTTPPVRLSDWWRDLDLQLRGVSGD